MKKCSNENFISLPLFNEIMKVQLSLTKSTIFLPLYFQIKLVDVEKVEWSNRRSYSAIGLFLGNREGRVLLRCDQGLEDWFELLDVSTNRKQK